MKNTDLIFTPNKLIINEYYLIPSVQYHDILYILNIRILIH